MTDQQEKQWPLLALEKELGEIRQSVRELFDRVDMAVNVLREEIGRQIQAQRVPRTDGAATELLSVLEEILDRYDDYEWRHGYDHVVLERAGEVVRKAKGE